MQPGRSKESRRVGVDISASNPHAIKLYFSLSLTVFPPLTNHPLFLRSTARNTCSSLYYSISRKRRRGEFIHCQCRRNRQTEIDWYLSSASAMAKKCEAVDTPKVCLRKQAKTCTKCYWFFFRSSLLKLTFSFSNLVDPQTDLDGSDSHQKIFLPSREKVRSPPWTYLNMRSNGRRLSSSL